MKLKHWNELKLKEKNDINILEDNYFEEIYDSNSNIKFLYIKKFGKIIAYVSFIEYEEFNDIVNIIVSEDYRLSGYGSKLLEGISNKNISLEVNESNVNAIKLYTKFGFKTIKTVNNYYKDNKAALVMHKIKI